MGQRLLRMARRHRWQWHVSCVSEDGKLVRVAGVARLAELSWVAKVVGLGVSCLMGQGG